ncbi:MAG: PIN domain-containing protein [Prolixibacteraceae bacterium]
MEIVDANIILRYLLNDHHALSAKSKKIIEQKTIHLPFEVCAEVVYVLDKVYTVPRNKIEDALTLLINYPNISTNNNAVIKQALKIYTQERIDFVDAILVAYYTLEGVTIHSFDKKLNKLCK